jgi:hypothetical protein
MNVFFWAPMGAAALHMTEEFFIPGGFAAWDRRYRPAISASITPRFHIIINGLLLLLCYDVGATGGTPFGVALWLGVTALFFSNAIWHVVGAIRTRSYSPGLITGLLLYVPLTVYGYVHLLRSGQAPVTTAILAFAVGASYQFWATAIHRLRTRGAETR